jgi:hypothetical protein
LDRGDASTHVDLRHTIDRLARQQDREDRLGADGARRVLQSSGRSGLVAERPEASEEAGRSDETYGATVHETGPGKPAESDAPRARNSGMDPVRELHTGQRRVNSRINQAGHTEAPEPARSTSQKPSCIRRGVHTRTLASRRIADFWGARAGTRWLPQLTSRAWPIDHLLGRDITASRPEAENTSRRRHRREVRRSGE